MEQAIFYQCLELLLFTSITYTVVSQCPFEGHGLAERLRIRVSEGHTVCMVD